ncbi:hypothetical protein H4S08_004509, partial [Coemansia sp. RSA 1365]
TDSEKRNEVPKAELVGVFMTAGKVKQRLDKDMKRACQKRRMLQTKMRDALNAAVEPNQQFGLLDFKLIDVLDEIKELKRRRLALKMAVKEGREIAGYNLGDARKAMVIPIQQWKGCWEAMQRVIQPKPAKVAQLMSPPSTPHDSSGDEF